MTPNNTPGVVAIVGATGMVGSMIPAILEERKFPVGELRVFASPRSAGARTTFCGVEHTVTAVTQAGLVGVELAFFAAGSDVSKRYIPTITAQGGVAIDKSSAYRMDPTVPLVVPEINSSALKDHHGIVSNPNCVATPLSLVLAPLAARYGIERVTVATYQAASGAGKGLMVELTDQERADVAGTAIHANVYPHVLHRNVVPGGWSMEGSENEEEIKVRGETRKILQMPSLAIDITTVRVPVMVGHAAAVWVDLEKKCTEAAVHELYATAPGVQLVDDPVHQVYPTPRAAQGSDLVQVGRIRVSTEYPTRVALFWAADNLRKGAATNAVQIAELVWACRAENV